MKKALGQTVRDLKRGVNKNVLKVPSLEQKVLDATSNDPWGAHGSLLADIAHASTNYHDYQIIMPIIWKRLNDSAKNWRHVYKALVVLDYLVANGPERVIHEISEHSYQISMLSHFQYIDSTGKDQGIHIRNKSQALLLLVNDKEKIQQLRLKAATNRDKFHNTSRGDMHRPGSYSTSGQRYRDRNEYGREIEWGYREEEKYGRHDGDRSPDEKTNDDHVGTSQSVDDYSSESRYDNTDDGQYSPRESGARAEDHSQDGSVNGTQHERRFSEQNLDLPPSFEESIGASQSPTQSERNVESTSTSAPKASSPHAIESPNKEATPAPAPVAASLSTPLSATTPPENKDIENFDDFDPRASVSVARAQSNNPIPTTSVGTEVDPLGCLSDPFSSDSLVLASTATTTSENADFLQMFEDPFGDGPFKAVPTSDIVQNQPLNISPQSFPPNSNLSPELCAGIPSITYAATNYAHQELSTSNHDIDILADILPPSAPSPSLHPSSDHAISSVPFIAQTGFPPYTGLAVQPTGYTTTHVQDASPTGFAAQPGLQLPQTSFPVHGQPLSQIGLTGQMSNSSPYFCGYSLQPGQRPHTGFGPQSGQFAPLNGFPFASGSFPHPEIQVAAGQSPQTNVNFGGYSTGLGDTSSVRMQMGQTPDGPSFLAQAATASHMPSQMNLQYSQNQTNNVSMSILSTPVSTALISSSQPAKDKFETKSTVWADTLSRGLVNLNISGSKTNPLADIGVDFDAINRKEKRMEKPSITTPVTSTVTMGKAMGSGSGIGRAGAGALRPLSNPMAGVGMGMGVGAPGVYGVSQPMGMGMSRPMNMNMVQGVQMQQPTGGSTMPGGYNPMMGRGNYGQQPFGGGYR
nr:clathrin interactor EPSIN 2 isoform X1 [Solanum lycopersicum]